jgi:tetratricopeptide (TPR) repeat protein
MYLECMNSLECSLGHKHDFALSCYTGYGELLCMIGRHEEALPLLERAYLGCCKTLGPESTKALICESLVGDVMDLIEEGIEDLIDAGRSREAEEMYILAIKSLDIMFGETHRTTPRFTSNYRISLRKAGLYVEALPLFERAYTRTLHILGPKHADTLRRKQSLKGLLEDMLKSIENMIDKGEHIEAENMYVRCTNSIEASLGKSDRYTLRFITRHCSPYT